MQFNNNLFPDVSIDKASKINFMLVGVSIAGTWFVIYLHELINRSPKPLIKRLFF